MWRTLLILILTSSALTAGCGAPLREARALERQGHHEPAALEALKVVRRDPGNARARRLSAEALQAAADARGAEARALAAEGRWFLALERLDGLTPYLDRAASAGVPVDTSGLAAARVTVIEGALVWNRAAAEAALETGSWAAAVARLEDCEALRPGGAEARALLVQARQRWAAEELASGAARAAADRLARNVELGVEADGRRAAALYVSLGRAALSRGACRAAVADLGRARTLSPGLASADWDRAVACARTGYALDVVASGGAPPPGLGRKLVEQLRASGSAHMLIGADPDRLPPRTLPGGPEGPPRASGPYLIEVTAADPVYRAGIPSRWTRRVKAGHGSCRDPFGMPWPGPCHTDIYVTYEEIEESVLGELSAVLVIRDRQNKGETLLWTPLRVAGRDTSRWRGEVISVMSVGVPGTIVGWDPGRGGGSAARAKEARTATRRHLAEQLSVDMAEKLSYAILSALDTEPAIPDPAITSE